MPLQDAACNVAAQSALADDIHGLALFDFRKALPQFINGNVAKSLDVPLCIFPCRPDIQQRDAAVTGQRVDRKSVV